MLRLCAETVAALQAFRKRHMDAQRIHAQAAAASTTVDLAHYRSVLKNKAIVDEAEKLLNEFKPVTYDVSSQIKAIETFEAKAVRCVSSSAWLIFNASMLHSWIGRSRSRRRRRPRRRLMSS